MAITQSLSASEFLGGPLQRSQSWAQTVHRSRWKSNASVEDAAPLQSPIVFRIPIRWHIKPQGIPRTISTVDEAYVDVFMVHTVKDDRLGDSIECTLSQESISVLHRFELPLYLSFGNSLSA